ncbi:superinfection immunity protein [Hymenobacter lutimineralis]|uniref:Superinfection immunity protein n=1 Tax=Hymenobacter lutimineralis TaxID=2606448 RepID=A0A5D6V220_9BACT|nr:superinfection immunity protein [Hymenobacter lutimineralis]TYZ10101.1 superinfection immunity protein [Hymenobacter lutimineralis]
MKSTLLFLGDLGGIELLLMLVVLPGICILHFLPSILGRKRPDALMIFLINLLAGWSIIGWFVALYLALRNAPVSNPFSSSPAFASVAAPAVSVADELAKLRDLRDQGVLTPEEFERQKNNLIS